MRLLIVSEEDEARSSLLGVLGAHGYPPPLFASSCPEAIRVLALEKQGERDVPIDVILVDADLPGGTALDLCRRFEEAPCLEDIPRLMMTARPGAMALEVACAAGAGDFVRKPIQADEFLGRLHAACALKHQLDTCREHTRELKRLNGELQQLSAIDDLTGIANRRTFNKVLAEEWARAAREAAPLSLLMIDIDFFKAYNDHYGHQRGDECLRRVADALAAAARRPGDRVARYGGEEFAVVLSHTEAHGARTVAEALRAGVEGLNVRHAHSPVHDRVTISLGVASTVPVRRGSADVLLAAADEATYAAKRDGRNRVRAYAGPLLHLPASRTPPETSAEAAPGRAIDHQE